MKGSKKFKKIADLVSGAADSQEGTAEALSFDLENIEIMASEIERLRNERDQLAGTMSSIYHAAHDKGSAYKGTKFSRQIKKWAGDQLEATDG